jgi:hypothetical protein
MVRKMMIALAATTFVGAMVAASTADAQRSGNMGGGGFRGGGMSMGGGGFRGGGMSMGGGGFRGGFAGGGFRGGVAGGGFRSGNFGGFRAAHVGGFRGGFVRPGFRHGFVGHRFAGHRFGRFHNRRFFAAAPFFVGASFYPDYAYSSYYDDPCWVVRWTPWGYRSVYVCNGYY